MTVESTEQLNTQEAKKSKSDLNDLLKRLGETEKKVYSTSDGIVDGNSKDTVIDEKLKEEFEKAASTQKKISIVKDLIDFFENNDSKGVFDSQEYKNLVGKYGEFKGTIDAFILKRGSEAKSYFGRNFFELIGETLDHIKENEKLGKIVPLDGKYEGKSIFEEYFDYIYEKGLDKKQIEAKNFLSLFPEVSKEKEEQNKGGFYVDKILKYDFVKTLNDENNFFLMDLIRYFNNIQDLNRFEEIFSKEIGKENPNFQELGKFILNIKDNRIKEGFVYRLNSYFKDIKPSFEEFFIGKTKKENFSFIDSLQIKDKSGIEKCLAFIEAQDIKFLKGFLEKVLDDKVGKDEKIKLTRSFLDQIEKSGIIITNVNFFLAIEFSMQNFLNLEDENDIKVYEELAPKSQDTFNGMFEKAKNNIHKIQVNSDFDEEYKRICEHYIQEAKNGKELPIGLGAFLKRCSLSNGQPIPVNDIPRIEKIVFNTIPTEKQVIPKGEKEKGFFSNIGEKIGEKIKGLFSRGLKVDENGKATVEKPIKLGNNGTIEMGQNGELIYLNSLGYKFEFSNDLGRSAEKLFEIKDQMEILDKVGIGFFGKDFRSMMDIIHQMSAIIPGGLNLRVNEKDGDFLDKTEINILFDIFTKIGFFDGKINSDNLGNIPTLTQSEFKNKMKSLGERYGEDNFYKNEEFNIRGFEKVILSKY